MPTDLCHEFAQNIANTRYENLSPGAIDCAKKSILDTLGVILAASGVEPAARRFAEVVRESGGRPESAVLGFGGRAPAAMAAFVNGALAHCLDFDDRMLRGAHCGSSLVPAALAVAERTGGVSGRQMIAAVAAGQDLFMRLRYNVGWRNDWNLSTVIGVFSATAAASRVLGLDREQIAHALGIASTQSCGVMETIFAPGSGLRGTYAGFSAKGAVLAALLAQKGVAGIDSLFEGKAGLFNVYFRGEYDRAKMLANLGSEYLGASTLYKPWPAVGLSHTYIHATFELMKQHRLVAADIDQIRVHVRELQEQACVPLESRRAPQSAMDAKYSIPFCIGLAIARGHVRVSDFDAAALKDPQALAIAQKVVPVEDRANWTSDAVEGRVEIVTHDGRTLERLGDNIPGSPQAPMTWDDIVEKFRDCASVSAAPLSSERIEKAQQMVRRLETVSDVKELIEAVSLTT
jgi:2-methylcitrate dehydratase PrpD